MSLPAKIETLADLVEDWDGKPIDHPGIFRGVPIRDYHGQLTVGPSISRSALWKLFDKSPRHYFRTSYLNPNREEEEPNEALLFGRAAHHVHLGERDFRGNFVVRPEHYPEGLAYGDPIPSNVKTKPWNGNSTWCKEWLADHRENDLRDILKPDHIEALKGMALGLADDPLVAAGALGGLIEHTIVWRDEATGIWVKIRPDAIPTDGDDVSDLKTCADISDDGLESAIGRDGLFLQGAMTDIGWGEVFGRPLNSFNFVFIEKTSPYCARTRELFASEIALGRDVFRSGIELFAGCIERDRWPGPGGSADAQPITMKPWHRTHIERRLAAINQELSL
jgi:hypothetical protein